MNRGMVEGRNMEAEKQDFFTVKNEEMWGCYSSK